jgi:hypothetical protein
MKLKPHVSFALLVGLIVVTNVLAGLFTRDLTAASGWPLLPWVLTAALIVGCFAIIGRVPPVIDWRGVLIDQRNRISLSRLQLVVWSLLVVSAVTTEGVLNAVWGRATPLALGVPKELWILLGLSTASFVAAPMVLAPKADAHALSTKPLNQHAWRDIFYGDDTGNADQVDFSKVQQFFFTIVLVTVYAVALGSTMISTIPSSGILTFPPLDPNFIGLMAVSQIAYIAYKAMPQNRTDAP